jgi:ribose 5-phosphate isomerase A
MASAKENAAQEALKLVQNKMVIGLGSGSTANIFIQKLAEAAKANNWKLKCVPTSVASEKLARENGLEIISLADAKKIHLAIDGADKVDEKLNLIKGYGGALAREKVVGYLAKKFVVVADESKIAKALSGDVPVEVLPFAVATVERKLMKLKAKSVAQRKNADGTPYITDNSNFILHADFGEIAKPAPLEKKIKLIPGVVECGIFSRNISCVIVGNETGARTINAP